MALIWIRKRVTVWLLFAARVTSTTSASKYYIKQALEYEDIL